MTQVATAKVSVRRTPSCRSANAMKQAKNAQTYGRWTTVPQSSRSVSAICTPGILAARRGAEAAQRHERERVTVEVVADVEVAREPGTGEFLLAPRARRRSGLELTRHEPGDAAPHRPVRRRPVGEERHHPPRRLRSGRGALSHAAAVGVRLEPLAEAA